MNIQQAIAQLVLGHHLSSSEMHDVMTAIMSGAATDAQIAGFIVALRMKGETVDEITAAAQVMRELASKVETDVPHLIDIVGTGGDALNTFNISTTVSFIAAACGAKVAKHGNRAVSSKCGSADVLEAAGININLSATQVAECITRLGIGFMFAPMHHSSMHYATAPRQQLGIRSLFNLLGPLTNPANARHNLIGVFSKDWLFPMATTLKNLGSQHALVIHSQDGMDEISICAPSDVVELKNGEIFNYTINPGDWGLSHATLQDIIISSPEQSAQLMLQVLHNQAGAARDIVILNAAAALYCADICESMSQAIEKATLAISSGAALNTFIALKQLTAEMK